MKKKYRFTRKYLDTKQMMYYLLFRWKQIVACGLAIGVIFSGISLYGQYSKYKQMKEKYPDGKMTKTISISGDDKMLALPYIQDMQSLSEQKAYNKNSLYMQLDPNKTSKRTIKYEVTRTDGYSTSNDVNTIISEVQSEEAFVEIAKSLKLGAEQSQYVKELCSFEFNGNMQATINIYGKDKEQTKKIGDNIKKYIEEKILPAKKDIIPSLFSKCLADVTSSVREKNINDTQQANLYAVSTLTNRIQTEKEKLSENAITYSDLFLKEVKKDESIKFGDKLKYTKKVSVSQVSVSMVLKVIVGSVAVGLLIAVFSFVLFFCATPFVWSGKNIADSFDLEMLGWIDAGDRKQKIRKLYNKMNSRTGEKQVNFLISSLTDNKERLVAVCDNCSELNISEKIDKKNIEFTDAERLINGDCKIGMEDKIIIIEPIGRVKYSQIDRTLQLIEVYHDNIIGCVTVE